MPFAASTTTRSGAIAPASTNESTLSTNPGHTSSSDTSPRRCGRAEPRRGAVADVEQPGVAADRKGTAADDLHAGVLLRVVRRGDADAAVEAVRADGVVDHLGADHPDVAHVGAGVRGPLDHGVRHRRRRQPHVAADRDRPRLEMVDVGAADRVGALLVELRRVEAAHVVRLEGLGREHGSPS